MIYRFMFAAYAPEQAALSLRPDPSCYTALSRSGSRVFLYIESTVPEVEPETLVCGDLPRRPDGVIWERAAEIFHYSVPVSADQWNRTAPKTPVFRVNYLKPEKIASYIFYHYQYQEEYPGDGDRYGVIYLLGNQMVFYMEDPTEKETQPVKGLLDTKHSPLEQWHPIMEQHFADTWRPMELLDRTEYVSF